eukprot:gene22222-biopygen30912
MWKCFYGLKQASRQRYIRAKTDMISIGFKEVDVDQGLFILPGPTSRPLLCWVPLWVNEFLLLSFHREILNKYKQTIVGLYKTRDLGEPSVFVGYEITRNRSKGTLHICQARFILELMAEPGSERFPIPLKPEAPLPYPETGQPETGLPLAQIQSKIQASTTALSSTEAEYVATASADQEAMWLRKLQHCATRVQPPTLTIHIDNQAALSAWNQEKLSSRLRHMETRFHFLKEQSKKEGIRLQWVPTAANMADMFTKALPRTKSSLFRVMIGCQAKT